MAFRYLQAPSRRHWIAINSTTVGWEVRRGSPRFAEAQKKFLSLPGLRSQLLPLAAIGGALAHPDGCRQGCGAAP